jgi:hypothetical protein
MCRLSPRTTTGSDTLSPRLSQVRDRGHPAVEDDTAGFRQSFIFKIDDVFQRQLSTDDRAHELETVGLGKDQEGASENAPLKSWRTATRFGLSGLARTERPDPATAR